MHKFGKNSAIMIIALDSIHFIDYQNKEMYWFSNGEPLSEFFLSKNLIMQFSNK